MLLHIFGSMSIHHIDFLSIIIKGTLDVPLIMVVYCNVKSFVDCLFLWEIGAAKGTGR